MRKSHQPLAGVQQKNSIPCNSKYCFFITFATCGRGQGRLVRQRSLQSCPRSPGQRSPSSGPVFLVLFDFKHTEPSKRHYVVDVLSAYLVPEPPLENALHTGEAEHQPEEVVDGHGMFGVGQLHKERLVSLLQLAGRCFHSHIISTSFLIQVQKTNSTACSAWINCTWVEREDGFRWHSILISSADHHRQVNCKTKI